MLKLRQVPRQGKATQPCLGFPSPSIRFSRPPLRPNCRAHRFAPGAGFAAGVDPAEEVVTRFAGVGRVVFHQVRRRRVQRGEAALRRVGRRRRPDEIPNLRALHTGRFGFRVRRRFIAPQRPWRSTGVELFLNCG